MYYRYHAHILLFEYVFFVLAGARMYLFAYFPCVHNNIIIIIIVWCVFVYFVYLKTSRPCALYRSVTASFAAFYAF